jgi:uracil-DNA glycosylase
VARIGPGLIVCLGATAAQGLLGNAFRVTRQHGEILPTALGPPAVATIHPSAVLRVADSRARADALAGLIADLRVAKCRLRS